MYNVCQECWQVLFAMVELSRTSGEIKPPKLRKLAQTKVRASFQIGNVEGAGRSPTLFFTALIDIHDGCPSDSSWPKPIHIWQVMSDKNE